MGFNLGICLETWVFLVLHNWGYGQYLPRRTIQRER